MPVAIVVAVPFVVVVAPAVVSVPVAVEKALAVMMRRHPTCALVGRTGPISGMPAVMAVYRMPITVNPGIRRAGAWRPNRNTLAAGGAPILMPTDTW